MNILISARYYGGAYIASSDGVKSSSTASVLSAVKMTALKRRYNMRCPSLNYWEDSGIKLTEVTEFTFLAELPEEGK